MSGCNTAAACKSDKLANPRQQGHQANPPISATLYCSKGLLFTRSCSSCVKLSSSGGVNSTVKVAAFLLSTVNTWAADTEEIRANNSFSGHCLRMLRLWLFVQQRAKSDNQRHASVPECLAAA